MLRMLLLVSSSTHCTALAVITNAVHSTDFGSPLDGISLPSRPTGGAFLLIMMISSVQGPNSLKLPSGSCKQ